MSEQTAAILGRSRAIADLRRSVPLIARSDAPTLITGSTGTGKEHVARAVHAASSRCGKPFVAINCAAIPDGLFESELFGFEKGAFTGATAAVKGKATLADGGTLFLDEIGELSPVAQSKLLRVLEEREVQPIGAARPLRVDLRVVAATNRKVEDDVANRVFRSDLFFRLNVARIAIPDLAERREDIPVYVDHFVRSFNGRRGLGVGSPDGEVAGLLGAYSWPGNVREVRNFVEGVFIDPPEGAIGLRHIPAAFAHLYTCYTRCGDAERQRILDALEAAQWNKVEAARALRWSRMTLYRKIAKYHLAAGTIAAGAAGSMSRVSLPDCHTIQSDFEPIRVESTG